ncbi:MAG: translation initiation factor [Fuerstiella sp.]
MTRLFAGTQFDRAPRCEVCDMLEEDCKCPPPPAPEPFRIAPEKQTAQLAMEKRKKGKMVTVIRGLAPLGNDLPALLTKLKNSCGAGGCLQEEEIEIQGKHLDRVRSELQKIGYKVKG